MSDVQPLIFDSNAMPWEERPNARVGRSCFRKMFLQDPERGTRINLLKYPAGFMTPKHRHPCGHGIFVLEGTVRTSDGDLGPGSFIWYPEGSVAEHGATDEGEAVVLFMTDKKFDIEYL